MAGSRPRATALTSVVTVVALLLLVGALWAFVIVDFNSSGGGAANASTNADQTSSAGASAGASDTVTEDAEGEWTMDDAREALAAEGSRTLVLTDSTGDGFDEWVHLWAEDEGLPIANWSTSTESRYNGVTESTRVWSAGMPESDATYPTERWDALWPAQDPDLVLVSYGHANDSAEEATEALETLREDLVERVPDAPIVIVLQNPSADDANADVREGIAAWADEAGLPTIDVAQAFADSGYYEADLRLDSFHPSTAGSELWAQTVADALG